MQADVSVLSFPLPTWLMHPLSVFFRVMALSAIALPPCACTFTHMCFQHTILWEKAPVVSEAVRFRSDLHQNDSSEHFQRGQGWCTGTPEHNPLVPSSIQPHDVSASLPAHSPSSSSSHSSQASILLPHLRLPLLPCSLITQRWPQFSLWTHLSCIFRAM